MAGEGQAEAGGQDRPQEPTDLRLARALVDAFVKEIGPGFHPENDFKNYVGSLGPDEPTFSREQAVCLDTAWFGFVWTTLESHGVEPTAAALEAYQRLHPQTFGEG